MIYELRMLRVAKCLDSGNPLRHSLSRVPLKQDVGLPLQLCDNDNEFSLKEKKDQPASSLHAPAITSYKYPL
jgi:hypothetical protein